MSDILIRWMKNGDYEGLVELENLIWNSTNAPDPIFWESAVEYGSRRSERDQLVAILDNKVVGYASFHHPTPLVSNRHVFEFNIGVHPKAQRLGVGRKLLDALKEEVKKRGGKKLTLRVLATNPSAYEFYIACGFLEQGRLLKEFMIEGKEVDDILMYHFI
jgi:ribosomal protein S18 acetylase RimI-like enzyme